jgi:HSP20 family protein
MTRLVRWDPFTDLDELQKAFFGGRGATSIVASPPADIYVNDNKELIAEFHLSGFDEKDIDISVDEGRMEVRAKHETHNEDKKKYIVRESVSQFYRSLALPKNADEAKVKADFEEGVLRITVPFKELPKPKKISVQKKTKQ